jgi:hypothetical protein
VVTHRFHIKPLLPWLSGNGHFFVLTLSRKEVRLLQGTRYSICELELQGVLQGIAEALRYEDVEKKGQHYPSSQGRPARGVSPRSRAKLWSNERWRWRRLAGTTCSYLARPMGAE